MIESAMVQTPEGCTNNIPMTPNPSVSNKKYSAAKSLCKFIGTLNVKHNTDIHRLGSAKENLKAIKR